MIEIVYKEEKQEARGNESYFHLPKNIRQIGDCKGKQKIYVEDYVYTYLKKLSADSAAGRTAILLGQYNWADGTAYFFIRGALAVTGTEEDADQLRFDEHVWKEVSDTMAKYFAGQNILGWFLSLPGDMEQEEERILKTHLNHFGGNDKVLFRMEPNEKEEAFYIYDSSILKKLGGFYIYYEKNEAMQNYMIDHGQNMKVEDTDQTPDQAVSDFRKIVGQKQEQKKKKSGARGIAWGVTVCAAAAVLALGLNYMADGSGNTGSQSTVTDSGAVAANGNGSGEKTRQPDPESVSGAASYDSSSDGQDAGRTDTSESISESTSESISESASENISENTPDGSGSGNVSAVTPSPTVSSPSRQPSSTPAENRNQASVTAAPSAETSAAVLTEYTVQKGDSLSKISERYYGTMSRVRDICTLNGITSEDVIYAGQKILLPK